MDDFYQIFREVIQKKRLEEARKRAEEVRNRRIAEEARRQEEEKTSSRFAEEGSRRAEEERSMCDEEVKPPKPTYSGIDKSTQTEEFDVTKCMELLTEMLENGQLSDITLNVKGKEFRAHRKILAAHSPVFAAMMTHDTKEKATGIVYIEDCEPTIFKDFLHFIYSGSLTLNEENFAGLYFMADKYQVTKLGRACVEYMKHHISLENFCDIMALSLRHHENELTKDATDYFLQNSVAIMKTTKWMTFLKENAIAGNELLLKALKMNSSKSV